MTALYWQQMPSAGRTVVASGDQKTMRMGLTWHLMRLASAAYFLLAVCGTISGVTARAQSGLLLGLSGSCDEKGCAPPNRTLWIAPQDGKLQVLELTDLIVPRKTGFWRVGTRYYCDPDEVKNEPHKEPSPKGAFFAAPVDQTPVVYGVVQCPTHVQYLDTEGACGDNVADGAWGIDVSFVNGEFISLNDWWRTDCGGHPDAGGKWSVEKLGDPARKPIAYGDIEGQGASDEYDRRAAHALIEQNSALNDRGQAVSFGQGDTDDDKEIQKNFPNWSTMNDMEKVAAMEKIDVGCFPEHDDKEWYIERRHGRWKASGIVWTHRLCGYYVDFALPLNASFAVPAAEPITLDALKTRIRIPGIPDLKTILGLKDRFWSPDQQVLVVIVNTDKACSSNPIRPCMPRDSDPEELDQTSFLQVYSPQAQSLGEPIISVPLNEFESPVMAEWATGSNVARWTTELKKIKAQGVVTPLLSSSPHP